MSTAGFHHRPHVTFLLVHAHTAYMSDNLTYCKNSQQKFILGTVPPEYWHSIDEEHFYHLKRSIGCFNIVPNYVIKLLNINVVVVDIKSISIYLILIAKD